MSFPPGLFSGLVSKLSHEEIAGAFEPASPLTAATPGSQAAPGLLHRLAGGLGFVGSLFLGESTTPLIAAAGTLITGGALFAGIVWGVSLWHAHEERLREEGRAQVRQTVNAVTISALQKANAELAKQAKLSQARAAQLEDARKGDELERGQLAANIATAEEKLAQVKLGNACVRSDAIIDTINKAISK